MCFVAVDLCQFCIFCGGGSGCDDLGVVNGFCHLRKNCQLIQLAKVCKICRNINC